MSGENRHRSERAAEVPGVHALSCFHLHHQAQLGWSMVDGLHPLLPTPPMYMLTLLHFLVEMVNGVNYIALFQSTDHTKHYRHYRLHSPHSHTHSYTDGGVLPHTVSTHPSEEAYHSHTHQVQFTVKWLCRDEDWKSWESNS